jgi:predicted RNA binding protein YcfA (HicA-like mRNA interferase family)
MNYREVARKLQALGCEELPPRTGGSHRKWHNPDTGRIAPVPDWGNKDFKIGTLRAIVKQLGLKWEDFQRA